MFTTNFIGILNEYDYDELSQYINQQSYSGIWFDSTFFNTQDSKKSFQEVHVCAPTRWAPTSYKWRDMGRL